MIWSVFVKRDNQNKKVGYGLHLLKGTTKIKINEDYFHKLQNRIELKSKTVNHSSLPDPFNVNSQKCQGKIRLC